MVAVVGSRSSTIPAAAPEAAVEQQGMFSMNLEAESGGMPSTYLQSFKQSSEYTSQHTDMGKKTLASHAHSSSGSYVQQQRHSFGHVEEQAHEHATTARV